MINPESSIRNTPLVVGIGASAGGLAALETFFAHAEVDSGFAYLVVQHFDPTKKALLSEILQRVTTLSVRSARHNQVIKADHVYVIPANREMTVDQGKLQLAPARKVSGLRLPVNALFHSLAEQFKDKAIGVVLSGMGSDGTLGLQAIKRGGGLTLVQTPGSAQFDSMPNSAIQAKCVDVVDLCEALPRRLYDVSKGAQLPAEQVVSDAQIDAAALTDVLGVLRSRTRHDFSHYKKSTLYRRIERRIAVHSLDSMASYASFLQENPVEVDLLFKELLIGVTSFFRDAPVWEFLNNSILPALLDNLPKNHKFRVWCAGCSTGEEAYSLAMLLMEFLSRLPVSHAIEFQIFASDLSPDAIEFARRGKYPLSIADQIPPDRLNNFFTLRDGFYVVKQKLRDKVLFAQHNLVLDPPFTKIDLLICRNLLIYLDSQLQQRLFPLFHYSLRSWGTMLLGSSETVGNMGHLFELIDSKLRFYKRRNNTPGSGVGLLLNAFPPLLNSKREQSVSKTQTNTQPAGQSLQAAADHLLLQVYSPAAVVVNADSDIVYISGRTGRYLEPAAGKANWNFHAMVRDGLRTPLFNALRKAADQIEAVEMHGLQVELDNPSSLLVDVTVQRLNEPVALHGMFMVVFRDVGRLQQGQQFAQISNGVDQATCLEELRRQQEENQRLREENHASQEELQSSNEELQSTNEELQSTNEELTTSKEEMQSMNEELQTINSELQAKLDDLALAQSDMQNLLNSTEIAILFLDRQLNVRRYTERAAKIISLRESDVGRPLSDLSSILNYPDLNADAEQTLRTLAFSEKQISGSDGRRFSVRIMPYKRLDDVIDGVVITLVSLGMCA